MARHSTRQNKSRRRRQPRSIGGAGPHSEYDQPFLTRESTARRLVDLAEVGPTDTVYDFGAGTGMITRYLVKRAGNVIAVELDPELAGRLREYARWVDNLSVVQEDCRRIKSLDRQSKVVANLPFGVTTDMVRRLTDQREAAGLSCLIVQLEAAGKFAGEPFETLFSLLAKPWFDIRIVRTVGPEEFRPRPTVTAALMTIVRRSNPLVDARNAVRYRSFVRTLHGTSATTLRGSMRALSTHHQILRASDDLKLRLEAPASQTEFHRWLSLFKLYSRLNG